MSTRFTKGQMEIMGLAIIVVLLLLGMLFFAVFSKPTDTISTQQILEDEQKISNFMNAMRVTTVPACNDATVEQLIIDCAQEDLAGGFPDLDIQCDESIVSGCDGVYSLIENHFFEPTFNQWNIRYKFTLAGKAGDFGLENVIWSTQGPLECRRGGKTASSTPIIPLGNGQNLFMELKLCS